MCKLSAEGAPKPSWWGPEDHANTAAACGG